MQKGGAVYELQECLVHGRRPEVNQYIGAVNYLWLKDDFPRQHAASSRLGRYQSILNPAVPPICKIGHCLMIEGSSTDSNTAMGQRDAVITFDLAIYIQVKQIQVKFPEEFSNTVVRLGGFHIALNYLSLLGKKLRSSGFEDLLIESGVYAAGTTSAIVKGKSYNRGIRAHKLLMECLFRQM